MHNYLKFFFIMYSLCAGLLKREPSLCNHATTGSRSETSLMQKSIVSENTRVGGPKLTFKKHIKRSSEIKFESEDLGQVQRIIYFSGVCTVGLSRGRNP